MARRLWAEAKAKKTAKGERDQLIAEGPQDHEAFEREHRERGQREQREREHNENREREMREMKERDQERETSAKTGKRQ